MHHSHSWHTLPTDDVLKTLESHTQSGLSSAEAATRLVKYGRNVLAAAKRVSPWAILWEQVKDILVIILLIAVGLSAVLGHEVEAIAIAVIVLFAVILGFVQEFRAEKAMEALRKMAAPTATVLRDGTEQKVAAELIVPGDIIILGTGDKVPADARIITSINLQADEAALTGESLPVEKIAEPIADPKAAVGDRRNILYSGTIVTYGRGTAIVVATAMDTEFGKIATLLQTVESEDTPLQKNLDYVGKQLAKAAFAIVVVISALGFYRGEPLLDIVIFGIALAVAVVPEALPAVVTISLAIGVQRMVKRHALIRRLPAVETLGSTTYICTDKTGTLTKDEMTVRKIFVAGQTIDVSGSGYDPIGEFSVDGQTVRPDAGLLELLRGGVLSSDATIIKKETGYDIKGDPTEGGIVVAAGKAGLQKEHVDAKHPRTGEIPFSSETKRMTTLHTLEGSTMAYAKGAPEVILASCTRRWGTDQEEPMNDADRQEILAAAQSMAGQALRVIAIARKGGTDLQSAQHDMKFLGLVGMIDPPRPEAKEAIQKCKQAGITVVMITGDHPVTAAAIARELGLIDQEKAITGAELDAMDDATFTQGVETIRVYARVSPAHKLKVVTALQKKGHIVAMTGDGVNDAPALKKADIGIAMGITGTDVTKEAAAMTLTDDNFASIVSAVEEGRGIFGNIKKYLMYLLSANIGEIGIMTGATLLGWPLPLSAVQILYINLATDGLPALALAVDPPEDDLMQRPPRDPKHGIFSRPVVFLMLLGGFWSTIINLSLFYWTNSHRGHEEAMTIAFACLVLVEFFKAYAFRSDHLSMFHAPLSNKWLNLSILWELILLGIVIYLPILQTPFGTFSLTLMDWFILVCTAVTIIPVLEMGKWIVRRGSLGPID